MKEKETDRRDKTSRALIINCGIINWMMTWEWPSGNGWPKEEKSAEEIIICNPRSLTGGIVPSWVFLRYRNSSFETWIRNRMPGPKKDDTKREMDYRWNEWQKRIKEKEINLKLRDDRRRHRNLPVNHVSFLRFIVCNLWALTLSFHYFSRPLPQCHAVTGLVSYHLLIN